MSPSPWTNLTSQARSWWDGATPATRIAAVGFAIALIIAAIMAATIASTPDYADLFTSLSPQDAAAIAQKLDDAHVKYQMMDNETTIRVPADEKDKLRMEMVRAGLPAKSGSVLGSEWLDKIGMSTTSDVQDQYIRLANEGELSRTISTLSAVSTASVHISPGSNTPFAAETSPTTASVVLGLKPGASLDGDQAVAVANLIAKSIPGLDLKDVSIIDTDGNQLWDGGTNPNGPNGVATSKIRAEQQFSEMKRREMQSYLDSFLGPHKAIVSVNAELNYNQVKSEQTTFAKGPVVSEKETSEKYDGANGTTPGGIAGAAANTPGGTSPSYPAASASGTKGDYQDTSGMTNYDNNKTLTETEQAQGAIQRLAVAVMIDSSIPPTSVTAVQAYLSTLAGVVPGDPTRAVTVQSVPFSNAVAAGQAAEMGAAAARERTDTLIKIAAALAAAGLLLFVFLKATGGSRRAAAPELGSLYGMDEHEALMGASEPETLLSDGPMRLEDVLAELPDVEPRRRRAPHIDIPEIEEHTDIKLESIRDMINHSPESVALLVKGWLAEEVGA